MDENPILRLLNKAYLRFLDSAQTILFFAAILLMVYMFVIQPHQVDGLSMYPTFHHQEWLLSYLVDAKLRNFKRGDVVVFHAPDEEDKLYIKRIIGLPGDTVRLENGGVYLNGGKLDESAYLDSSVSTFGGSTVAEGKEVTVPEDQLFVMGDNRSYSLDSRAWGFLPYNKLIGRSVIRIWPINTLKVIKRNPY